MDEAARPAADPACPGKIAKVRPHDDIRAAVVADSPDGLPENGANARVQTIDVLLEDYPEVASVARAQLAESRFVGGFQRAWSIGAPGRPGRILQLLQVQEFRSPDGACGFFRWSAAARRLPAFAPAGVAGAVGTDGEVGAAHVTEIYAVKGRFLVGATALAYGVGDPRASAVALVRAQYDRL